MCVRRIRVAVFSTGNELVSPGELARRAQLFDSNRFMLMAMLAGSAARSAISAFCATIAPRSRARLQEGRGLATI